MAQRKEERGRKPEKIAFGKILFRVRYVGASQGTSDSSLRVAGLVWVSSVILFGLRRHPSSVEGPAE